MQPIRTLVLSGGGGRGAFHDLDQERLSRKAAGGPGCARIRDGRRRSGCRRRPSRVTTATASPA